MEWDGFVRPSCPPKYVHKCPKCGHCEVLSSVEDDIEMPKEEKEQVLGHEVFTFEQMKEMQQMQLQHDYEALRNQAAIAAMQGVMNFFGSIDYNRETIAKLAVEQADALIEELKKSDT